MSTTALFESYDVERLQKFKSFLEQQLKDVEKAIEDKTPGLPFDKFHKLYVDGFRKDHPYSKKLYNFYKEVYVGHEKEFGELVESWDDIYTIQEFAKEYYDYLREMYNACGSMIADEYSKFLAIGRKRYVSNLAIMYVREYGIEKYNKYLIGGYYDIEFGKLTTEEKKFINNKTLSLPTSDGKFKTFTGYDDDFDDDE